MLSGGDADEPSGLDWTVFTSLPARSWPLECVAFMAPFLYRCPNTGLNVQSWVADDPTERDKETYETVACAVCTRLHVVNPATGKVLGADDD